MNKGIIGAALAVVSVVLLSGCQTLDSDTPFLLDNTDSYAPRALSGLGEQQFYSTEISDSFTTWLTKTGWDKSYEVNGTSLEWIPQKQDDAYPSTVSKDSCTAWVEYKGGTVGASLTTAYIYRVVDGNGEVATSRQISEIIDHLSSDLQRRGWDIYSSDDIGSAVGSAGQLSWYVSATEEYKPVDGYLVEVSGAPNTDYISYRLTAADRGNGYFAFYISAPCAPIKSEKYDQLQGDIGSAELDLIESDSKNPNNTTVRP